MSIQAEPGELLVGAYLRLVEGCELVTYNQRSQEAGDQMEIDVLGVNTTTEGEKVIYTCEVVTHLNGLHYSGTPSGDRWDEYGSAAYQHTLERISRKFNSDRQYVTDLFDSADTYVYQLWSPIVPEGHLTRGLSTLANEFGKESQTELDLVINEYYTEKTDELRQIASETEKDHGEMGFRFLQILAHLR